MAVQETPVSRVKVLKTNPRGVTTSFEMIYANIAHSDEVLQGVWRRTKNTKKKSKSELCIIYVYMIYTYICSTYGFNTNAQIEHPPLIDRYKCDAGIGNKAHT